MKTTLPPQRALPAASLLLMGTLVEPVHAAVEPDRPVTPENNTKG